MKLQKTTKIEKNYLSFQKNNNFFKMCFDFQTKSCNEILLKTFKVEVIISSNNNNTINCIYRIFYRKLKNSWVVIKLFLKSYFVNKFEGSIWSLRFENLKINKNTKICFYHYSKSNFLNIHNLALFNTFNVVLTTENWLSWLHVSNWHLTMSYVTWSIYSIISNDFWELKISKKIF